MCIPPGASGDIVSRLMARKLTDLLGQQFVVDNRAGGGVIGGTIVANAPPDGYTLMLTNPAPNISAPLMSKNPPYRIDDLAPVVLFGYAPLIILAHNTFQARDPKELIAAVRANPGKYSWGTSGVGSTPHIGLALLQLAVSGFDVVHVPYKGTAPALVDLLGGQTHLIYTSKVSAASVVLRYSWRIRTLHPIRRMEQKWRKRVQPRRKPQPDWTSGEDLQRRMGSFLATFVP